MAADGPAALGGAAVDASEVGDGLLLDGGAALDPLGAGSGVGGPELSGAVDEIDGRSVRVRVDADEAGPAARSVLALEDGKGEATVPEPVRAAPGSTRLRFGPVVLTRTPASTPRMVEAPSATMLWVRGGCIVYTVNQVRRLPVIPGGDARRAPRPTAP